MKEGKKGRRKGEREEEIKDGRKKGRKEKKIKFGFQLLVKFSLCGGFTLFCSFTKENNFSSNTEYRTFAVDI